jgi:hypothetical protein
MTLTMMMLMMFIVLWPLRSNATRKDAAPSAFFKGFGHVKRRSKHALMEALLRHGPVAISLDASQPTFKFYSEGVYSDKHCLVKKVSRWFLCAVPFLGLRAYC